MPEFPTLLLFIIAAWILLITPGPAVLYIVTRSIDQGRIAGLVSTLGIALGTMFHVAAAALGVSALLMSSALAFNIVKYLGAAYLVYLGICKFLQKPEAEQAQNIKPKKLSQLFYQGIIVNLLNPKTAIFFFAFLPQFADVNQGLVALQILFLGSLFVVMGIFSDGLWALLAGTAGNWLRGNLRFLQGQHYFSGGVFIALGLTAALTGSGKE